jgi:hypothetical protein
MNDFLARGQHEAFRARVGDEEASIGTFHLVSMYYKFMPVTNVWDK